MAGRVSCCARLDTLNRRYICYPFIRCSVGQLTLPFLSQAPSTAPRPTLDVLSLTTFDTLHTLNESSLERAVSLRSVLHTLLHLLRLCHPRHYLSNTVAPTAQREFNKLSPVNKTVFLAGLSTPTTTKAMRKEVRIEEVICTILESIRPVRHPRTGVRLPIVFSHKRHPSINRRR